MRSSLATGSGPGAGSPVQSRWGRQLQFMTSDKKEKKAAPRKVAEHPRDPDWAASLKHLYDSVVEEPIPDSFKELLRRLDSAD